MERFVIFNQFGRREPGIFLAKNKLDALGALARRKGYASVAAAGMAWVKEHRVELVAEGAEPQPSKSAILQVIDAIRLTGGDRGTAGRLVRRALYEMAGRPITREDVDAWLAWQTNGRMDPGEDRYLLGEVLPLLDAARIDVLGEALRALGFNTTANNLEICYWKAVPSWIERALAEVRKRRSRTTDSNVLPYLDAVEAAAADILEGRGDERLRFE